MAEKVKRFYFNIGPLDPAVDGERRDQKFYDRVFHDIMKVLKAHNTDHFASYDVSTTEIDRDGGLVIETREKTFIKPDDTQKSPVGKAVCCKFEMSESDVSSENSSVGGFEIITRADLLDAPDFNVDENVPRKRCQCKLCAQPDAAEMKRDQTDDEDKNWEGPGAERKIRKQSEEQFNEEFLATVASMKKASEDSKNKNKSPLMKVNKNKSPLTKSTKNKSPGSN